MAGVRARISLRCLPAFFGCLLLIHLAEYIPAVASAEPTCVWYGICSNPTDVKKQNCEYKGPPKPIATDAMPILQKYCPELVAGGTTCCDTAQLRNLDKSIEPARNLLARCPSCWENFLKQVCAMTCSPRQSEFLFARNVTNNKIYELDYHIGKTYIDTTFESCSQVRIPSTGGLVFDWMCGSWASTGCTPERLFDFMGNAKGNSFVPFQINYIPNDESVDGFIPFNPKTRPCNLGVDGQPGCSCLDCDAACPAPPPRPPPHKPFSIAGADGYAVVMAIVFVIFTTLFLGGVFCCNQAENAVECLTK